jgi:hypothetical protein
MALHAGDEKKFCMLNTYLVVMTMTDLLKVTRETNTNTHHMVLYCTHGNLYIKA